MRSATSQKPARRQPFVFRAMSYGTGVRQSGASYAGLFTRALTG
jgi:hypothetical protein